MRIGWTPDALAELDHVLAYIAAESPGIAAVVAERDLSAEETIRLFPRAGRFDAETDTYDRYMPKTRIIVTYAIRGEVIWIVSVWHTSRDPDTKPKRS